MRFSKIKDNDIANGIGITMSLWTQGCPHHCKGCFNLETWDFNGGKEFTKEDLDYILNNNTISSVNLIANEDVPKKTFIKFTLELIKSYFNLL